MNGDAAPSAHRSHQNVQARARSPYGLVQRGAQKARSHRASQSPTPLTSSSVRSAIRVDELKRVLSGAKPVALGTGAGAAALGIRGVDGEDEDTGSDSMVSYDGSSVSGLPHASATALPRPADSSPQRPAPPDLRDAVTEGSVTPRPHTASSAARKHTAPADGPADAYDSAHESGSLAPAAADDGDAIPPVPPLPASLPAAASAGDRERPRTSGSARKSSGGGAKAKAWSMREQGPKGAALAPFDAKEVWGFSARDLLLGIDADVPAPGGGFGAAGAKKVPPY